MSMYLITLVLLAAILHATWNTLIKSGGNPLYTIASFKLFGVVPCLLLIPFVPTPARESWWALLASVLIHNVYYFTMARAYKSGDLSQVYPLFRGLAPILVAIAAAVFADEYLSRGQIVGIVLVSIGLMSLTLARKHVGEITGDALFWGLITSLMIAGYTLADGLGVRASGSKFGYILWLFLLEIVPVGLYLLLQHRAAWFAHMRQKPIQTIAGSITSSLAYGLVIYAMSLGAMALVSSLRETSVIFAVILGTFVLKEPFGRHRLMAAALVAVGIVVMRVLS